jgi:DNA-binding transcriptional LysR family regulator
MVKPVSGTKAPPLVRSMNGADASLEIDGRLLVLLVAVVETRSVTRAAERLGVTQSAVSHGLERLRALAGEALVVKAGRGIAPTARAEALAERARALLDGLHDFAHAGAFDPAACDVQVTIGANPLQRDLLLPRLLERLRTEAPRVTLRVVASDVPTPDMLRDRRCQLVISPRLPEGADIAHERLFEDRYLVFYDTAVRAAPATRAQYVEAEHVGIAYDSGRALDVDRFLAARGVRRRFAVQVSEFSGVAPFLRGTDRLATLPSLTAVNLLRGFARAPVPLPCPPMPMHMIWHRRFDADPMHAWLRRELVACVAPALAASG